MRAVADGAAFLSPAVARRVIDSYTDTTLREAAEARRRVEALTEREREVLTLLGAGHSTPATASRPDRRKPKRRGGRHIA